MTFQRYPIPLQGAKGIITDIPACTDRQKYDDALNFMFRKGRLQTRPNFSVVAGPPDGKALRSMYTFEDAVNNFHTLGLTTSSAYFLTAGMVWNPLTLPIGIASLAGTNLPFALREINQQVYFCNGSTPLLYVDGEVSVKLAGNVPGSCFYLTENAEHLIGLNWIEPASGVGSTQYPFRVRWSDSGDPTSWINNGINTSGAVDLIESGGVLTGAATIGRNTYIVRKNGASVMNATGNATQPFIIEPFMWSSPGWGNYYPYSLVTFSSVMICVTEGAEVLMFDGSNFTRLASGKVRSRLANDLSLVQPDSVVAFVTNTLGANFDHEGYWLSIPGANITWVHDLVEGTWQRINSSLGWITSATFVGVA